jgi:hypothetical protein
MAKGKRKAKVSTASLRHRHRARLGKLEVTASSLYEALRAGVDRALQSLESLQKTVEQEFAAPQFRKRMKAIDKDIARLKQTSRQNLSSLVKATEQEVGAITSAVKNLSVANFPTLRGKSGARKRASRKRTKSASKAAAPRP